MRPPPVPQQEGDGSAPITPTTPTTPITPTTPGGQPGIQSGICILQILPFYMTSWNVPMLSSFSGTPKPQGSQPMSSPHKGKQLRVPKPTKKYENYCCQCRMC